MARLSAGSTWTSVKSSQLKALLTKLNKYKPNSSKRKQTMTMSHASLDALDSITTVCEYLNTALKLVDSFTAKAFSPEAFAWAVSAFDNGVATECRLAGFDKTINQCVDIAARGPSDVSGSAINTIAALIRLQGLNLKGKACTYTRHYC